MRDRAVVRHAERQRTARRRQRRGIIVDGEVESAEMSLGCADRALDDGKFRDALRRKIAGLADEYGNVEMICEQPAGFDGALIAAVNQGDAVARQADQWK